MKNSIFFALILLFITSCSSGSLDTYSDPATYGTSEPERSPQEEIPSRLYEVKTTETIISVARKHHTTPQMLIALNNIRKPYTIRAGQLLKVPTFSKEETGSPEEKRFVRISPSDYNPPEAVPTPDSYKAPDASPADDTYNKTETSNNDSHISSN